MYNKTKGNREIKNKSNNWWEKKKEKKRKKKIQLCDSQLSISVLRSIWLGVVMAAMLYELFGLALASGLLCSSPGRHVREMVYGARVNLDLPARRLYTEQNEHKQSRGERRRKRRGVRQ